MVIYSQERPIGLSDYGILIPVHPGKARRALEALEAHPRLGPLKHRWHMPHHGTVIAREDLLRVHSPEYVERLFSDRLEAEIIRTYELIDAEGRPHRYEPSRATRPLAELLDRALYMASGTYQCCRAALENGFCFFFGGGSHHAHRDYGKGFCLINDVAISLRRLQAERRIRTAWVIDVDAHKGDGTAALSSGDDSIRTLSIHMAAGWPLDEKPFDREGNPNPSFIPSDIDIPVGRGEEGEYLSRLEQGLERLASFPRPDLGLVVLGADPYELDELASTRDLRLTKAQMLDRDRLIYRFLEAHRLPGAYLASGGYGQATWEIYYQFLEWALQMRLGGGP